MLPEFDRQWNDIGLSDIELAEFQAFLCLNPEFGVLVSRTGGVRKIRWALPGRGKSGGVRVLYLDILDTRKIYLLTVYAKNEKANLSNTERKIIQALVENLKHLSKRRIL